MSEPYLHVEHDFLFVGCFVCFLSKGIIFNRLVNSNGDDGAGWGGLSIELTLILPGTMGYQHQLLLENILQYSRKVKRPESKLLSD